MPFCLGSLVFLTAGSGNTFMAIHTPTLQTQFLINLKHQAWASQLVAWSQNMHKAGSRQTQRHSAPQSIDGVPNLQDKPRPLSQSSSRCRRGARGYSMQQSAGRGRLHSLVWQGEDAAGRMQMGKVWGYISVPGSEATQSRREALSHPVRAEKAGRTFLVACTVFKQIQNSANFSLAHGWSWGYFKNTLTSARKGINSLFLSSHRWVSNFTKKWKGKVLPGEGQNKKKWVWAAGKQLQLCPQPESFPAHSWNLLCDLEWIHFHSFTIL